MKKSIIILIVVAVAIGGIVFYFYKRNGAEKATPTGGSNTKVTPDKLSAFAKQLGSMVKQPFKFGA